MHVTHNMFFLRHFRVTRYHLFSNPPPPFVIHKIMANYTKKQKKIFLYIWLLKHIKLYQEKS